LFHAFVLQIADRLCQLSQSKRLDRIFPLLEVYDDAAGNSGLARLGNEGSFKVFYLLSRQSAGGQIDVLSRSRGIWA
jgi:hypothetical protein